MLEAAIYKLLKAHFKKEKYYVDLLELFLEVRRAPTNSASADLVDNLPDGNGPAYRPFDGAGGPR